MSASSSLILLAGMHRSGTSLLASLLPSLGVPLPGELIAADIHNPEGYFERSDITDLQEQLQIELGRWWPSASGHLPYSSHWLSLPSSVRAAQQIERCIRKESAQQAGPWALKDPRISLLLPLWKNLSTTTAIPLQLVISVRDPAEVMVSLQQRDGPLTGMTPWRAQRLIWRHLRQLLLDSADLPALVVAYSDWFAAEQAERQLIGLAQFCRQAPTEAARREALQRIEPDHRRSQRAPADLPLAIQPLLLTLQGRLETIARLEPAQQVQPLAELRHWLATATPPQLPPQPDQLHPPGPEEQSTPAWFDPSFYREQCRQQGLVITGSALEHFEDSGGPLGLRPCPLADPIWAGAASQRRELWPAGRLEGLHPWGSAALALSEGEPEAALHRLETWLQQGLSTADLEAIAAAEPRHFALCEAAFAPVPDLSGAVRLHLPDGERDDPGLREWLPHLPMAGDWHQAPTGDEQAPVVGLSLKPLQPGRESLAALPLARAVVVFDPEPERVALLRRLGVNARLLTRTSAAAAPVPAREPGVRQSEPPSDQPPAQPPLPGGTAFSGAGLKKLSRKAARKLRRSSFLHLHPVAPSLHNFLFFTLRRKAIAMARLLKAGRFTSIPRVFLSDLNQQTEPFEPLVSIIVPNYNHATYLTERLDSIFEQSYRHFEVILLDDASSDGSQAILRDYHERHRERSQLLINAQNSGSPFQQWRRGLQLAKGELIWIAESDDFCDRDFLSQLVPQFANPAMMLAFCQIQFVDESAREQVWSMEQYLPELGKSIWETPLVSSAHQLTGKIWHRRNLIPNVSAALFRNCRALPLLQDQQWLAMKICGDWLFYLQLARGGLVAYTPETTSYYRQHPQNTSVSLHRQRIYLEEHLIVAEQLQKLYRLDAEICHSMQAELRRRWLDHRDDPIPGDLLERLERLHPSDLSSGERNPNLLIATYSLIAGGGEILPIRLANVLKELGFGVTVLNCHQHPNQPGVRRMLRQDIPMIELNALDALGTIVHDFGIELVHSHHAWVDTTICELLHGSCDVCHVITSHGMYDEIEADEIARIGALLGPWVRGATYVADRNLEALLRLGIRQEITAKIANAIDPQQAPAIERASLGISEDAFVVCLVSRGIREKGWQEAIEAVQQVRAQNNRDVQLLILGDGKELHRLQPTCTHDFIHFLGFQAESGRYFASADLGILPSFYPGESQPLTLLECLGAGRPYLASDVGEIRAMLSTPDGLAGQVVPLEDGKVNPQAFADCLSRYLEDPALLERHTALARLAARKFDPAGMGRAYSELYRKALTTSANPTC